MYFVQQQNDKLRDVYNRVIINPVNGLKEFWSAYNTFENNLNKTLVRIRI